MDTDRAFWGKAVAESTGFTLAPDHPDAANREDDTRTIERILPADLTRALRTETRRRLGLALYPVLCGPLYQALAQMAGGNKAVLSHRMTGRCTLGALDVTESVGNFAVHFPLPLATDHLDADDLCRAVAAQLASVPHAGASYDWFGKTLGDSAYPDDCLTPLRVNYLGVLPPDEHGVFRFAREHHNQRLAPPEQIRSAELELHLAVSDDRLSLRLSYAQARWDAARLEALIDDYLRRLEALAKTPDA
ncbi:condensation domain-containing protein [Breoghania sp. L-A4]|uniref:condensation domain-containing protein n=1 Tax=Breoghania sp. L-A4 TaxID=2304600 RepID=UPI00210FAE7F|nr:condensation domain-containing protein [Breoghania sp. L-A4]